MLPPDARSLLLGPYHGTLPLPTYGLSPGFFRLIYTPA